MTYAIMIGSTWFRPFDTREDAIAYKNTVNIAADWIVIKVFKP